jgi:hypothetical protein
MRESKETTITERHGTPRSHDATTRKGYANGCNVQEQKYRKTEHEPEKVQTYSQEGSPKNSNFNRKVEEATVVKVTSPDSVFIDDILATLSNSYRTVATSELRFNNDRETYYIFVNVSKREHA